jgi:hypothetical protein
MNILITWCELCENTLRHQNPKNRDLPPSPRAEKLGLLVASASSYQEFILHSPPFFYYTNTLLMWVPIHILNTYHYSEMGEQSQNCNSYQLVVTTPKVQLFSLAIIDWSITPKKRKMINL